MSKVTIYATGNPLEDVTRAELIQESNAEYVIPPSSWRTWDALQTNLPGTAAADDLELTTGTLGTNFPSLQAGDIGGTASTRYAATTVFLPPEYDDGESAALRCSGGMLTTVCDASCTVDFQCYINDGDATSSADIVTTSAQTINSLTFANKDFTLTSTNLAAGSELFIRIAITYSDTGDLGVMIPVAGKVSLLLDIRG